MSRSSNITVAVRVRPLSQKEVARGAHQCLEVYDGCRIDVEDPDEKMGGLDYLRMDKHKDRSYAFDHAFDPRISQSEAFESTTNDLLPDVMNGRNACCFAYGATGSGKTFTMTGSQDMPGIIPHTVDALFEAAGGGDNCIVTMQYVEIYNEQIKDLLQPSNGNLDVREAPGRGTFVAGAANVEVTSRDEVQELVESASRPLLRHRRNPPGWWLPRARPLPGTSDRARSRSAVRRGLGSAPRAAASTHGHGGVCASVAIPCRWRTCSRRATRTARPSRPSSTPSRAARTRCSSCAWTRAGGSRASSASSTSPAPSAPTRRASSPR